MPLKTLRLAMNAAFADYAIPMTLDPDTLALMMPMRGLETCASRLALADGAVVAFWLPGLHDRRAYLISSGTTPGFRRQGSSRRLGCAVIGSLRASGVETLQSEVLVKNARARGLYRGLGMAEVRDIDGYTLPDLKASPGLPGGAIIESAALPSDARDLWDLTPSWQNDSDSLRAAGLAA